ncbi:MAG: hypothetical protein P4L51_03320 [Puia sp.]|nr:hypothetical protein [Puia sp.]
MSFWKSAKDEVLTLSIEQVVSSAGDGILRDQSACSTEFREFLGKVPVESLFGYARHCLDKGFTRSGLALQDIVNEFGRRLEFQVEDGLYQGTRKTVGFDGIWRAPGEPDLVIEVKTTDSFTVDLDTHARYKERLLSEARLSKNASTLIVVGRRDTGALEAQIRGSRYAWDMRLISVERLIKLVQINEKSDDPNTLKQIRQLLQPFEYTKIDRIIDVIFTTAVDVETQQELEQEAPVEVEQGVSISRPQNRTDYELLNAKRQEAVEAFSELKGKELVKRSRTLFWSSDKELRVCCAVSKKYESDYQPYWYAFHPKWDAFLAEAKDGYFVLACMDRLEAFAVPYSWILAHKHDLNMTENGERSYWHIAITTLEDGELAINTSKVGVKTPLAPYRFPFGKP